MARLRTAAHPDGAGFRFPQRRHRGRHRAAPPRGSLTRRHVRAATAIRATLRPHCRPRRYGQDYAHGPRGLDGPVVPRQHALGIEGADEGVASVVAVTGRPADPVRTPGHHRRCRSRRPCHRASPGPRRRPRHAAGEGSGGGRAHQDRGGRPAATASTSGRPSSSIRRSSPTSSRPAASGSRTTSSSNASTRNTTSCSREDGLRRDPRHQRHGPARGRGRAHRARGRQERRKFFADNRVKLKFFKPVLEQAFHTLRAMASPGDAGRPAPSPSRAQRRQGPAALLQGPAGPPRLRVPDQVPRHVAVPLPEPVHDPVVPRIRARGLPPGRRLRRRLGGDGGPRPPHGRRHPPRRRRRAGHVRGQARQRRGRAAARPSPPTRWSSTATSPR